MNIISASKTTSSIELSKDSWLKEVTLPHRMVQAEEASTEKSLKMNKFGTRIKVKGF
jgi:hypothetical protein